MSINLSEYVSSSLRRPWKIVITEDKHSMKLQGELNYRIKVSEIKVVPIWRSQKNLLLTKSDPCVFTSHSTRFHTTFLLLCEDLDRRNFIYSQTLKLLKNFRHQIIQPDDQKLMESTDYPCGLILWTPAWPLSWMLVGPLLCFLDRFTRACIIFLPCLFFNVLLGKET